MAKVKKDAYEKENYDIEEYQKFWLHDLPSDPTYRFIFRKYHQFWQDVQERDLTYLEFGGGPSIYPLISAASHLKHVVFSEYNEDNRKAIEAWRKKEEGGYDWGPTVKYIVGELEGKGEDQVSKRQDEIREKIRAVVRCNIHNRDIVETQDLPKELGPPYDVVSTSLCLVDCIPTNDQYKEAIRKLTSLLKPGGYLFTYDVLGASFYLFREQRFDVITLTEELVKEAFELAGLEDIKLTTEPAQPDSRYDPKHFIFAMGRLPRK